METTKTLQTQLLEFQKKISVIKKDSKNPHFKNTYASLAQILSEVKPVLNELGIVLTQPILDGNVTTDLSYNGVSIFSSIQLPAGLQPQPLGSAITYFRRYTIASLLALEIDDDDAQSTNTPPKQVEVVKPLHIKIDEAKAILNKSKTEKELGENFKLLMPYLQLHEIIINHAKAIKKGFTNG